MNNKLNAIATFLRVVEAGSFSAAARQCGMKQSAVSQQIAALEEELGWCCCTERRGRWR
jgi:DNA-binding transcriptional LysR family regulator